MRVLVVEDEVKMAALLRRGLSEEGLAVDVAEEGERALLMAGATDYDAVVLDVMLPGIDGFETCRRLRRDGVWAPVLMLTARGSLDDRVVGLDGGADDYMVKPFAFAELLARLNALARRPPLSEAQTRFQVADLEMDLLKRTVTRAGERIELQPREFRLLEFLLRHVDQVVTRTILLEGVWDYHFDPGTNVIDVHLSRLRKKIDEGEARPLLHTVRGAGYRIGTQP